MIIGVLKELKESEYRVSATPQAVQELVFHGHRVLVEKKACSGSGFSDEMYINSGAEIKDSAEEIWNNADIIYKVKEILKEEYKYLREDSTVITYIHSNAHKEQTTIEDYMACHQANSNASELWLYFSNIISWVKTLFPTYKKEQKGIEWGELYNQYKDTSFNPNELEKKVNTLMQNDEVTNKKGVYYYLITSKEKYLNIREFSPSMKRALLSTRRLSSLYGISPLPRCSS